MTPAPAELGLPPRWLPRPLSPEPPLLCSEDERDDALEPPAHEEGRAAWTRGRWEATGERRSAA